MIIRTANHCDGAGPVVLRFIAGLLLRTSSTSLQPTSTVQVDQLTTKAATDWMEKAARHLTVSRYIAAAAATSSSLALRNP